MNVSCFFRGTFSPDVQEAIEQAITGLEKAFGVLDEQEMQWLILNLDSEEAPSVAATRLSDGRTFRTRTHEELIAAIQAAATSDDG